MPSALAETSGGKECLHASVKPRRGGGHAGHLRYLTKSPRRLSARRASSFEAGVSAAPEGYRPLSSAPRKLQAKLTQVVIIRAFVVDDIDAALLHARQLAARYVARDARHIGAAGSPDGRWSGPDANAGTQASPGTDRCGGVVGPESYVGNSAYSSDGRRHARAAD